MRRFWRSAMLKSYVLLLYLWTLVVGLRAVKSIMFGHLLPKFDIGSSPNSEK